MEGSVIEFWGIGTWIGIRGPAFHSRGGRESAVCVLGSADGEPLLIRCPSSSTPVHSAQPISGHISRCLPFGSRADNQISLVGSAGFGHATGSTGERQRLSEVCVPALVFVHIGFPQAISQIKSRHAAITWPVAWNASTLNLVPPGLLRIGVMTWAGASSVSPASPSPLPG